MVIDCDSCSARGSGCADCVVTALLGPTTVDVPEPSLVPAAPTAASGSSGAAGAGPVELDDDEQRALAVLAQAGLVAPLRLAGPADTPGRRRAV
jgi:hypothetical protein